MRRAIVWSLAAGMVLVAGVLAVRAVKATPQTPFAGSVARSDPVLAKCRMAGEAAARDPACLEAWRAARARFFGRPAS